MVLSNPMRKICKLFTFTLHTMKLIVIVKIASISHLHVHVHVHVQCICMEKKVGTSAEEKDTISKHAYSVNYSY